MNNTAGAKTFDLKFFGKVSPKQAFGLIAAFALALMMTVTGFGNSCSCVGMMLIAVILFMLPRALGVNNLKLMTLVGLVFVVSAILIGGLIMAPAYVNDRTGDPPDNDFFANVEYTYTGSNIEIKADLLADLDSHVVYFDYYEVMGIGFGGVYRAASTKEPMLVSAGGEITGNVTIPDPNKLYIGLLTMTKTNDSGEEVDDTTTNTREIFLLDAFDGDVTKLSLYGCFMGVFYIAIIFFMIMVLSTIMRDRMERTRTKMEKEGRLYPKGHGRCEKCGNIVLPGEVKCRKCGSYIDRPEEMKPDKKDFFECSDCGAEVPTDAKSCPKCGAYFDEEEFEVTHSDGTVEKTKESFQCPECGGVVPGASTFCPRCGAKFKRR
jgi:ribosomal protein L40E